MKIINFSRSIEKGSVENKNPIFLFYQFFIHNNPHRNNEIKKCLKLNVENTYIDKIYLLNEKIYTDDELGVSSDKIIQIDIKSRLKFKDVFNYITNNNIYGYNVIINADIFCDSTIQTIKFTNMHIKKQAMALLRYEYAENIKKSKIFGPRFDSQDTWIIHSEFIPDAQEQKIFNFEFGKPGCDNKIIYLLNILGYQIFNDPLTIKTYHIHSSQVRDYSPLDCINKPWGVIIPAKFSMDQIQPSLGIDLYKISNLTNKFTQITFNDNHILFNYIKQKLDNNKSFIIPRIAGVENNYAVEADVSKKPITPQGMEYINRALGVMKNNAGIKLTSLESIKKYSQMYMESFQLCDMYSAWEPHGDVYKYIENSHNYIKYKYSNKQPIWAFALDIFHYIKYQPWTYALANKRILIISSFEDSIKEKIPIREEIYGIDLFPGCEITTIKPPQTQGSEDSEEFDKELDIFFTKLNEIKDTYDIALVSAGGYGNLICAHIYKSGKSAIYVGGVLQMYFGILGNRWLKERSDIVRLYMNLHWSRPKEHEKPKNHNMVENSCYW